ncbi:MAG: hypothetical protein KAJ19_21750, partial [Gammaproteobacteria bacterium]|nr:hypothetical protein [Gammaproteobacteria bacterium]
NSTQLKNSRETRLRSPQTLGDHDQACRKLMCFELRRVDYHGGTVGAYAQRVNPKSLRRNSVTRVTLDVTGVTPSGPAPALTFWGSVTL